MSFKPKRLAALTKKKNKIPLPLKIIRWLFPKVEVVFPYAAHRYFITIFFTPLRYPVPEKEQRALTFAQTFTLPVAGQRVQGYTWGEGHRYVLLVHGWAGRATQFRRFVKPLLAAGYKVVAFDGPAHGNSTGKRTHIREFNEVLKQIYQKFGTPEAVLAHSFGGGAVLMAAMNGLPVTRLVNISTPTDGDEIINTFLRTINGSASTGEYFKKYVLKQFGEPFVHFTSLYFIKHLPAPVELLLVHDEDDRDVGIEQAEALQREYPSAELIRTKGLGHTRILRDNAIIEACVTFIRQGPSVSK